MIGDTVKAALITSWKTTAMGLAAGLALLLAKRGVHINEAEWGDLIQSGGLALIGFFAKDADKSHTQRGQ